MTASAIIVSQASSAWVRFFQILLSSFPKSDSSRFRAGIGRLRPRGVAGKAHLHVHVSSRGNARSENQAMSKSRRDAPGSIWWEDEVGLDLEARGSLRCSRCSIREESRDEKRHASPGCGDGPRDPVPGSWTGRGRIDRGEDAHRGTGDRSPMAK